MHNRCGREMSSYIWKSIAIAGILFSKYSTASRRYLYGETGGFQNFEWIPMEPATDTGCGSNIFYNDQNGWDYGTMGDAQYIKEEESAYTQRTEGSLAIVDKNRYFSQDQFSTQLKQGVGDFFSNSHEFNDFHKVRNSYEYGSSYHSPQSAFGRFVEPFDTDYVTKTFKNSFDPESMTQSPRNNDYWPAKKAWESGFQKKVQVEIEKEGVSNKKPSEKANKKQISTSERADLVNEVPRSTREENKTRNNPSLIYNQGIEPHMTSVIFPGAARWFVTLNEPILRESLRPPYCERGVVISEIEYIGPNVTTVSGLNAHLFFNNHWGSQIIPSGIFIIEGMEQGGLLPSVTLEKFEDSRAYRREHNIKKSALSIFFNSVYHRIHVQELGAPTQMAFLITEAGPKHITFQEGGHKVGHKYKLVIIPTELKTHLMGCNFSLEDDPRTILERLIEAHRRTTRDESIPIILAIQLALNL